MSNSVDLLGRNNGAHQADEQTIYSNSSHHADVEATNPDGSFIKFLHNYTALVHGKLTGERVSLAGCEKPFLHKYPVQLWQLEKTETAYRYVESLPYFLTDRVGYAVSWVLQKCDTGISKYIIGAQYQSPQNPFKADSLCDFFGRILVGISSLTVAAVRIALLVTSLAIRVILMAASFALDYLVVTPIHYILTLAFYLLGYSALVATQIVLFVFAIVLDFAKLLIHELSLGWFTNELPIDRGTFSAVIKAFERFESYVRKELFDMRPNRDDASRAQPPLPDGADAPALDIEEPLPQVPHDLPPQAYSLGGDPGHGLVPQEL